LLENQPNPMEIFKKYSYDEMKQALQEWLNPEDEAPEEGSIIDDEKEPESDLPWEDPAPKKANYSLNTAKKPASKADKFDAMFDDE
jgi:hypothetical protein